MGLCVTSVMAQCPNTNISMPSTEGKNFWLSFMKNYINQSDLTLIISAKRACSGTVSNPNTGWSTNFSVGANNITSVTIPATQAYCTVSEVVKNLGVCVTATDSISLFASNFQEYTYDVTNVLPTDALGMEYVVQSYTPLIASEFLVVATENNTTVQITPKARTQGGHYANTPFSVTLNAGQVYQVISNYSGTSGDLTGSIISANKKVAVFNGNVCANIPVGVPACDHIVEQAYPIGIWGKNFIIPSTSTTSYDVIKVTALNDNTQVRINNQNVTSLQAGRSYEFNLLANRTCYIETSEPCATYLYINGGRANYNSQSDPAVTWISPIEQGINDITFSTFQTAQISRHFVNIVCRTSGVGSVLLDGVNIGNQFSPIQSNPDWSYVRKQLNHGMHRIQGNTGFVGFVYGTGLWESYAYSIGSRAASLSQQMLINNVVSTVADRTFCTYDQIDFTADINYSYDSLRWDFGDNTPIETSLQTEHFYTNPGNYQVTLIIYYKDSEGLPTCASINAMIQIFAGYSQVTDTTLCEGDSYSDDFFDIVATDVGMHTYTYTVPSPGVDCDTAIVLQVTVLPVFYPIEDYICLGDIYQEYGFNLHPTVPGTIYDTLVFPRIGLCDSIVTLKLNVYTASSEEILIEGPAHVCLENTYEYGIDSSYMFDSYEWTSSVGATILDGNNTNHVNVYFDDRFQNVPLQLSVSNPCSARVLFKEVEVHPIYSIVICDTACVEDGYHENGFDIDDLQLGMGDYAFRGQSIYGCDSMVSLMLFVTPTPEISILAQPEAICVGEESQLHAMGELAEFGGGGAVPAVAIGDILCTDNSIVKPQNFASSGKTAMGIVFYVDSTGEHGWAVELTHSGSAIAWGGYGVDIPSLPNFSSPNAAITDLDGYTNTQKIRAAGNANTYPAAYAVNFAGGWYLPAAGQLRILFAHIPTIENTLTTLSNAGTTVHHFDGGWYWSSTEYSATYAWRVYSNGDVFSNGKGYGNNYLRVRGVRAF